MKYKTEHDLEKEFMKKAKHTWLFVRKMNCDDPGFPDLFVAYHNYHYLMEIKLPKKRCKIKDLFEKSQIPWFIEYNNSLSINYFLFYYYKTKYYLNMLCNEYLDLHIDNIELLKYNNITEVISYFIKGETE